MKMKSPTIIAAAGALLISTVSGLATYAQSAGPDYTNMSINARTIPRQNLNRNLRLHESRHAATSRRHRGHRHRTRAHRSRHRAG